MSGPAKPFLANLEFVERTLDAHGDCASGVGWKPADADVRYQLMLEAIRLQATPVSVLDFGCGAGHLLEYIRARGIEGIEYHGLDASGRAIALCQKKFPGTDFLLLDVLDPGAPQWPRFDYVIMNGIMTYKGGAGYAAMFDYARDLLRVVFEHTAIGLAFNVMSKQVDLERDDLFHIALDPLIGFLSREISRHFVVRADYGLYEYTVHVYRESRSAGAGCARRLVGDGRAQC